MEKENLIKLLKDSIDQFNDVLKSLESSGLDINPINDESLNNDNNSTNTTATSSLTTTGSDNKDQQESEASNTVENNDENSPKVTEETVTEITVQPESEASNSFDNTDEDSTKLTETVTENTSNYNKSNSEKTAPPQTKNNLIKKNNEKFINTKKATKVIKQVLETCVENQNNFSKYIKTVHNRYKILKETKPIKNSTKIKEKKSKEITSPEINQQNSSSSSSNSDISSSDEEFVIPAMPIIVKQKKKNIPLTNGTATNGEIKTVIKSEITDMDVDANGDNGDDGVNEDNVPNDSTTNNNKLKPLKLKLIPINQLLSPRIILRKKNLANPLATIDLSSEDSDELTFVRNPTPKIAHKNSSIIRIDDDDDDDVADANPVSTKLETEQQKSKSKTSSSSSVSKPNLSLSPPPPTTQISTKKSNQSKDKPKSTNTNNNTFDNKVCVSVKRLPKNMEPLLRKHGIKEILNEKHEVIVIDKCLKNKNDKTRSSVTTTTTTKKAASAATANNKQKTDETRKTRGLNSSSSSDEDLMQIKMNSNSTKNKSSSLKHKKNDEDDDSEDGSDFMMPKSKKKLDKKSNNNHHREDRKKKNSRRTRMNKNMQSGGDSSSEQEDDETSTTKKRNNFEDSDDDDVVNEVTVGGDDDDEDADVADNILNSEATSIKKRKKSNSDDSDVNLEKLKKNDNEGSVDDDSDDFTVVKKRKSARETAAAAAKKKKKGNKQSGGRGGGDGSDDLDDDDFEGSDDSTTKKPKKKRRRIKNNSGGDSSGDEKQKNHRRNIRAVIKTRDLEDETKRAAREENERKKRIEERQKLYNEYYDGEDGEGTGDKTKEVKELDKLILDFDEETKDELIKVDKKLVTKLKPHQGSGVKFMWNTCFESIERIQKSPGSGCILAHCMGLGKTLQVVTLVHTLLAHRDETNVEKVLVICPLSTVLNWVNEFKIWLKQCAANKDIEIYEISKYKQNYERVYQIKEWHEEGGVLIMGYDMFRNLSSETSRLKKREKETVQTALVDPGPDLVVCDEGHLLKNSKTSLSKAVNRLKTLRRIVLTGTPLQNNLNEYYCMVQFVKPNLLGKYNEYLNRFVNPITNGQYVDSTPYDIQMMKRRSHILHKLLDGCVQRRDYAVLAPYLPYKHEYVVYIKLTKLQIELYNYYMTNKPNSDNAKPTRASVLFSDFQNLQRIWTHPRVLRYNSDRFEINAQKKRDELSGEESESEGSIKDFIASSESEADSSVAETSGNDSDDVLSIHSDESLKKKSKRKAAARSGSGGGGGGASTSTFIPNNDGASSSKGITTRRTRANADKFEEPPPVKEEKVENPTEWWMSMCPPEELDVVPHSGKLMLLFSLLEECEQIGDKLLVFSQSLFSLDVIEHFLAKIDEFTQKKKRKQPVDSDDDDEDDETEKEKKNLGGYTGSWSPGLDYFRLDGSTSIENRNLACKSFNRDDNLRARLFLISTRAGGLGINLVAANRVVIFDVSWNPSHDIQSIFRVYRFGQKKPCYIYRFIAMGTMEEKIYERQVTKLAISKRVIDEHQIDRHYKENDLMELYKTNLEPEEDRPVPILPKDRLFALQLRKFDNIIFKYHEHDSLLENKSEETLNQDEIKAAWEEFEAEKIKPQFQYAPQQKIQGMGPVTSNQIFGFRSDVLLKLLNLHARKTYPMADESQVRQLVPLLLQQLYERMHNNDVTMYHSLLALQSELEGPTYPYSTAMAQMGGSPHMMANSFTMMNQNPMMQQQNMIAAAQNRLMGKMVQPQQHQQLQQPQMPPTQSNQIIELD